MQDHPPASAEDSEVTRERIAEIAEALVVSTTSAAPLRLAGVRALVASHPLRALFVSVVAGLVVGLALPLRARR